MIKRYLTRGSLYVIGKDPYVEYIPQFCRVVKYDDHLAEIAKLEDSLIVWHDLRKDPEDLPEESEEIVYVTGGGMHGFATMIGDEWADNHGPILNVILWYYPPKPSKE